MYMYAIKVKFQILTVTCVHMVMYTIMANITPISQQYIRWTDGGISWFYCCV